MDADIVTIDIQLSDGQGERLVQSITYGEFLAIRAILNIETQNHTKMIENKLKTEDYERDERIHIA